MSVTGLGTLLEFQDGLGDAQEGPGRVGGPSGWSGTGRRTLGKVRDGSGPPGRSEMGRGTLRKVRAGLGDPR